MPHVPGGIDAAIFVIQQGALDIGGMGLLKLAKRANLARDSFPVRLGACLVLLMILNVALASIKHTLPMIPAGVFVGIETLLLIARAIAAVLYGHAIHALREEYGDSTLTVKEAEKLQGRIEELTRELGGIQRQVASVAVASDVSDRLTDTDRRLTDQTNRLSDTVAALHTLVQEHTSTLTGLAALPVRLSELERSLSSLATATSHKPHLSVVATHRPGRSVSVAAAITTDRSTDGSPNTGKGAFVRRCLTDHPAMRVSDIQRLAASQGMKIAHSCISDIRKTFGTEQEKQAQQETA